MAQPLSRVRPNAMAMFHAGALRARPELVPLIMHVIENWSHADLMLTNFLTRILKADHITVSAMMQAITSGEGRRAALNGAVSVALRETDKPIFAAVMKSTAASRAVRNQFAHHIWGYSPDLPEALLLVDPKFMAAQSAVAEARDKASDNDKPNFGTAYDTSMIFVWRRPDLERQCKTSDRAVHLIGQFHYGLHPTSAWRGLQRGALLDDPEIRKALEPSSHEKAPPDLDAGPSKEGG